MTKLNPIGRLRGNPLAADSLLAAGLTAIGIMGLFADAPEGVRVRDDDVLVVVLTVLAHLPVAWRRRAPQAVLLLVGTSAVLIELLDYHIGVSGLGVLVALYSVAAHTENRRRSIAALIGTGLAITVVYASFDGPFELGGLLSNYILFATAWILGDNLQTRRAYVRSLEERAVLAEAGREEEAREAVRAERTRIARELHDVVAHGVSVMVVQAGAARRVLDREPERAGQAMSAIESTGRQSLHELRRLLGMLRDADGEPTDRLPQPGVDELGSLLHQTGAAGLPVSLDIRGLPRPLAAGVDLTVYRIVQEALTNVLKHAGPATATVCLGYGTDTLELVVSDDGRGFGGERAGGHGIVGMQERVSVFGGDLHVGNRPGGGFTVRATLPLEVPA